MTMRKAAKAGTWYRSEADALAREVDACLAKARETYGDAGVRPGRRPVAAVVPHAGLSYSGHIAALAYMRVREAYPRVDLFVVFGACHRARLSRPAIWPEGEWETPLGPVAVDAVSASRLIGAGVAAANADAHRDDNAIELQTPFIKRMFPEAAMLPIAISPAPDAWRAGERAFALAGETGKTVVALASTDLTHYGAAFGLMPAGTGPGAVAWTLGNDRRFLDALAGLELAEIAAAAERDSSACGGGAAAAAAGWAKAAGSKKGRLLAHATSYEIRPEGRADHLVAYAAMLFEKEESQAAESLP